MKKKACIICDIDNVIVDSREWGKYIPEDNRDRAAWKMFWKNANLAKPNRSMLNLISILSRVFPIIFITSRENYENSRMITKEQIKKFSFGAIQVGPLQPSKLYMREAFDYRKPYEVKEEILLNKVLPTYNPILAIDDDKDNVKMFRKYNIFTYHYKGLTE